jgi:hypothetical protein
MANITLNETNRSGSEDFLTKAGHAVGAFFAGGKVRVSRNVSELSDSTLADIGLRRDQLMPYASRLNEKDQRYYWI